MKMLRLACVLALCLSAGRVGAQQVTCGTISPSSVSGTYTPTSTLNLAGRIDLTCTRNSGSRNRTAWLGIDNGPGTPARNLDRTGGGGSLPYQLHRNAGNTGTWTTGPGQAPGSAAAGGALVALDFSSQNVISVTVSYHFQVLAGNYARAGSYSDNPVTLTVRLTSDTGPLLGTATFVPAVTLQDFCRLSTPPGNMALSYTSFSGSAATASTNFGVQCLDATAYSMAVDAASGSALGLTYTLGLSSSNGVGNGAEQTHTINGSIAAGQSGTCAVASCSATQQRTLTITY
ncbi:hypothetical protein EZ313_07845 [Ramlibacter henchirensis]|uniref:Spore coat protein U/FanG domain-containing protein n=1 Tax=Ramlibacter henchirensis TaxID=204072 RepID=A0A4Z0C4L4_9BURK|nr:spore coat protein U domain-containing protein [Ramlibacter henchirensis]TFZ06536.1 hypothetical protein EZ313_07845 [Ramlibacter henchirensis]